MGKKCGGFLPGEGGELFPYKIGSEKGAPLIFGSHITNQRENYSFSFSLCRDNLMGVG